MKNNKGTTVGKEELELISDSSRRRFLKKAGLSSLSFAIGADIVFAHKMPHELIPAWFLGPENNMPPDGKHPEMITLNDRPINMEAPPHLLDPYVTPSEALFVRNNGIPPQAVDLEDWSLEIGGESVVNPTSYSLKELKNKFENVSLQLTIECGGNGRAEFDPPAKGNQWTTGAVGCPKWTGVRLRDVLNDAGVKPDAVYIGYYGKDTHLSGAPDKPPISRGVPISKALEAESMIAWSMNDETLPNLHGYPLRLVFGGWPASTSGKWLHKIDIRNKVHDGPKMGGDSYRVPCDPVAPGTEVPPKDMCIIESMPVKSIITTPKTGAILRGSTSLKIGGHAWAGDLAVANMHVSIDFGSTWTEVPVENPTNRLAWQRWDTEVQFPKKGYYEVWARATDESGVSQPLLVPGWNPKGYLNNACHRIAVKVLA